ncbi:glycoside hydrolase family 19 protein [Aquimarina longa]|uniref:glycoside hydrolase family 19 protein n=1 Tax=Aquimarina longa TaxID=1080221 RepID=UPI0009EC4169|nr:glycoside hydrolase family 19 protein [Aquimarina longa]
MKHKLTVSKYFRDLCNKSWIMIFATLLLTASSGFSSEPNVFSRGTEDAFFLNESSLPVYQATDLINKELWNTLFPYRFGSKDIGNGVWVLDPKDDFYTYESFIEAINRMSKIKVIFDRRCGTNAYKVTRVDKTTGVSKVIRTDVDFDAPRHAEKEIITEEVDYGMFLEEGDLDTRKREITAFFANISHETTGGWSTAPGGRFSWGLHFREEPTQASYAYPDTNYPPTPGKSYKGRGPIQLSYNYNYGPASEFIFGDKQILLDNPEKVIEDAALAFQTAIWFWMTPQYPKPSAHNVMVDKWVPNELDKTKNRVPGLGMTVNIINGGVECGQGTEKPQVLDRIGYYERFTELYGIGTDMDGVHDLSDCGCKDMTKYGGDSADLTAEPCAQKPQVTFSNPKNNQIIKQTTFSPISVSLSIDEKNTKLLSVTTTVGSQTFNGKSFNWTPSSYATHILTADVKFENGTTASSSIKVIIWDGVNLDCQEVPEWNPVKIYKDKGTFVKYSNKVYKNKWYADSSNTPGVDGVWELIKSCDAPNGSGPVITWQSPSNGQIIEQKELTSIDLKASANDSDGSVESLIFKYNSTDIPATLSGNSYTANFTPTAFGEVTIIAKATDNENKTTEKSISFTIKKETIIGNKAPVVSITSPVETDTFKAGASISITVNASDSDGTIDKIEYFNKNTKIGESLTNPYTYTITDAVVGDYVLTAKATDNEGLSTVSEAVKIIVSGGNDGDQNCAGVNKYVAGTSYGLNEEVANESEVFKCDIPGWCSSSAAWAYAPGTGAHWQLAWTKVGACKGNTPQQATAKYSLYPTITENVVNLKMNTEKASWARVDLYDFAGKLVRTQSFNNLQGNTEKSFTQDLSGLKKGLYIFKIYMDGEVYLEKILKN